MTASFLLHGRAVGRRAVTEKTDDRRALCPAHYQCSHDPGAQTGGTNRALLA